MPMKLIKKRRVYNLRATTKAVIGRITTTIPIITAPLSSTRGSDMSQFGSAEFIVIKSKCVSGEEEADFGGSSAALVEI